MADTKRPQQFHPSVLSQQENEMRRLELGEAWAKDDFERIGEITQEMKNDGISGIGNEHYRAQEAFGEFEVNEETRLEQQALQPSSAAAIGEPESDPQQKPIEEPRQQPGRRVEATPEREAEADPERQQARSHADLKAGHAESIGQEHSVQLEAEHPRKKLEFSEDRAPARTYADLKQEHAEIVGRSDLSAGEPGQKKLEFSEDRESARGQSAERENARPDAHEQGDGQRKSLEFAEDHNQARSQGMEH